MPTEQEYLQILKENKKITAESIFIQLAPRPWDLTAKGLYYWFGFFVAFILYGVDTQASTAIGALFELRGKAILSVLAVFGYGLLVFIIEEVILQQAKLLWDDIRDKTRDQKLPLNRERAIASGQMTTKQAIFNIGLRIILSFCAGYLLGGWRMVIVFSMIVCHQMVYVLLGKPRAKKQPLLLIAILSINLPLRFFAGFVLLAGFFPSTNIQVVLLLSLLFFHSMGNSSLLWRIEVEYLLKINKPAFLREQSEFYLKNGRRIQRFSLFAALLILAALLLVTNIDNTLLLQHRPSWVNESYFAVVTMAFVCFAAYMLEMFWNRTQKRLLVWSQKHSNPMKHVREDISRENVGAYFYKLLCVIVPLVGNITILIGMMFFIFGLFTVSAFRCVIGFALYNIGFMVAYEFQDFLDYTMVRLKEQLNVFGKSLFAYLFTSNSGITLLLLIKVLMDYEFALKIKSIGSQQNEETI